MRRILHVGLVAVFVFAGCASKATAPSVPTAVRVATVDRATSADSRRYSAQIVPASRVDLAFKVGGYVEALATVRAEDGKFRSIQEGDAVSAGLLLGRIRPTDYIEKRSEALAAVAQAKAAKDQSDLDLARVTKLSSGGSISAAELDSARIRRQSAQASLDGANARLAEAETALDDTSVRSPIAGVLLRRGVEKGTLAAPGTVGFSVADVSDVKAVFGVPDTTLARVHLGASQAVVAEAYQGASFVGRISRIAPSADAKSRVFDVEVTLANADQRLKPGMVVALSLDDGKSGEAASYPLVPLSAIVRSKEHPGAFAVFLIDEKERASTVHLHEVELGDYLGRFIPVNQGLAGGERVIVQGAGFLEDGELVEVIP